MPAAITAPLTPATNKAGKEATAEVFQLTDIPVAMDKLGWKVAARVMRQWFRGAPYELPKAVKQGDIAASTLSAEKLITDIPFDWLFTASTRVKPEIDQFVADLSSTAEFNKSAGRLKGTLDELSNGLVILMTRLKRLGLLDADARTLKSSYVDYSDKSAIQLEELSQFNIIRFGATTWEKATDSLDDVYGALGTFVVKIAATKFRTISNDHGFPAIEIEQVGFYVRDTYDFLNVDGDQLLGYWSREGVIRPGPIDYLSEPGFIDKGDTRYFKVTNGHFNKYRELNKKGGDMMIYTAVKLYETSFIIHLGPVDFEEFQSRASGK
ncbi:MULTISPECIES: DUF6402 family protein [unclassified Pseudomonas]|uniref:DUF6402 family protein n=1 Tax=unclassified Pseudomonas TaxID=196821 RepID=UPI002AC8D2C4|nr:MULTISPECIES: DUF6402 family protein [unclassified Pseudomonas]MEB0043789.1 DUF6402 family protein [Pseudomonas sp. Dout3]MEB0095273.1 DUF6402 family protein [Pseudomonas sp. DC1.2]WPX58829.1 DUF6402 family protein [Pseudomonas sp. DC1.2]